MHKTVFCIPVQYYFVILKKRKLQSLIYFLTKLKVITISGKIIFPSIRMNVFRTEPTDSAINAAAVGEENFAIHISD